MSELESGFTDPAMLTALARSPQWHYGWKWSGPEDREVAGGLCPCTAAECGLLSWVDPECPLHGAANPAIQLGTARQLHRLAWCPKQRS